MRDCLTVVAVTAVALAATGCLVGPASTEDEGASANREHCRQMILKEYYTQIDALAALMKELDPDRPAPPYESSHWNRIMADTGDDFFDNWHRLGERGWRPLAPTFEEYCKMHVELVGETRDRIRDRWKLLTYVGKHFLKRSDQLEMAKLADQMQVNYRTACQVYDFKSLNRWMESHYGVDSHGVDSPEWKKLLEQANAFYAGECADRQRASESSYWRIGEARFDLFSYWTRGAYLWLRIVHEYELGGDGQRIQTDYAGRQLTSCVAVKMDTQNGKGELATYADGTIYLAVPDDGRIDYPTYIAALYAAFAEAKVRPQGRRDRRRPDWHEQVDKQVEFISDMIYGKGPSEGLKDPDRDQPNGKICAYIRRLAEAAKASGVDMELAGTLDDVWYSYDLIRSICDKHGVELPYAPEGVERMIYEPSP